jgi:hypothetical protein
VPPTKLHLHVGARQSLEFLVKAVVLHFMRPMSGPEQSTGCHGLPEDLTMGLCS